MAPTPRADAAPEKPVNDGAPPPVALADPASRRRYFEILQQILSGVRTMVGYQAREAGDGDRLASLQFRLAHEYLQQFAATLEALAVKYTLAGLEDARVAGTPAIDASGSGFPAFQELMQMTHDALQIDRHLDGLPSRRTLKVEMVDHILSERTPPRALQYAMSQRIYYETLRDRPVFLAQNHPRIAGLGRDGENRMHFLVHWAVLDSGRNLPTLYFLHLVDSGRQQLNLDEKRWPRVQDHLRAQSLSSLKLLTIARGFDEDFDDLHPRRLRRVHLGPAHVRGFTRQRGPVGDVLGDVGGDPGETWAFEHVVEELVSERTERRSSGLFSEVDREIYALDTVDPEVRDAGASAIERSLVLTYRPYQLLADRRPPQLARTRIYVVDGDGHIMAAS